MNSTEIKLLLEKYFTAKSSLFEERQLRELFTSGDYPSEFEPEAKVFIYTAGEAIERKKDANFENELRKLKGSIPDPIHRQRISRTSLLAAASVILLAGLFMTFRHTYLSGEEQAAILHNRTEYKKFCMTMNMISSGMSSGNSKTKKIDKLHPASLSLDRNNELQ